VNKKANKKKRAKKGRTVNLKKKEKKMIFKYYNAKLQFKRSTASKL